MPSSRYAFEYHLDDAHPVSRFPICGLLLLHHSAQPGCFRRLPHTLQLSALRGACPTSLQPHMQQVLAGRDPRKIVAAHQAGSSAAAPEGGTGNSAGLADAHAAVLAARKAEHADRRQAATGEAAQLAGGGGIAGERQSLF
jgi:hypothetical protein